MSLPVIGAASTPGPAAAAAARGFDCLIEARQTVELRSPVEGVIERVHAERGDSVRRGQLLVELDATVERANLAVARQRAAMSGRAELARARIAFAQRKLERNRPMAADQLVPAALIDEIETELRLAEAELKDALESQELARLELRRAEELLQLKSLRSPFDAYVVERAQQAGDLVEAGGGRKPIFKLAQIDLLRVEVVMPQAWHGQVRAGARALVRPEGRDQRLEARVAVVDRVIDAASATFGVRLELPNRQGAVAAGTRCSVEFPGLGQGNAAAGSR